MSECTNACSPESFIWKDLPTLCAHTPQVPGTELTRNFVKNHILKRKKENNMCSLFLKREREKTEVCEVGSFHPHSSVPESLGVTRGVPSFSSSSSHQEFYVFLERFEVLLHGSLPHTLSCNSMDLSAILLPTLQPGAQEAQNKFLCK